MIRPHDVARILIVEDNADLAAGIEYNLGLEGYETRIADDGRRALAMAEDRKSVV